MAYKRSLLMEERLAGNRQRIIQAARDLVAIGGFREAQMAAVAAGAGVSTGLIYRHFPSKADLFVEVLTAAVDAEIEILDVIARAPGSATERLHRAIESFVRRALAGPDLAHAFIAEPVDADVDAERIRCRRRFGDVFKRILRDGIADGDFPAQDVDVTAACIVGAFTEALVGPTAPRRDNPHDKEQLVASICSFCIKAAAGT